MIGRTRYVAASGRIRINVIRRKTEPERGVAALFRVLEMERANPEVAALYPRTDVVAVDARAGLAGRAAAIANITGNRQERSQQTSKDIPIPTVPATLADIARQIAGRSTPAVALPCAE